MNSVKQNLIEAGEWCPHCDDYFPEACICDGEGLCPDHGADVTGDNVCDGCLFEGHQDRLIDEARGK